MGVLANFCNQCGNKFLPENQGNGSYISEMERQETIDLFCNEVGHDRQVLITGAKYCFNCGIKL